MRNGPVVDDYRRATGGVDWEAYGRAQARWHGVTPPKPGPVVDDSPWRPAFDAYVSDWEDEF